MLEAFCLCFFFLSNREPYYVTIEFNWIFIFICFWLVWGVFAAVKSTSQPHSVIRQLEWFVHILFGFCIFTFLRSRPHMVKYLNLIVIIGFFILIAFLVAHWHLTPDPQTFDWIHPPFLVHIRQLSDLAVAAILLIPFKKKYFWAFVPLLSICWGVLFWSGGRAGILSVCFGVLVIAFLGKRWDLLFYHGIAAVIGFQMALFFPINVQRVVGVSAAIERTVNGKTMNSVFSGRFFIWELGLEILKGNWMFGLGPDGFKDLLAIHQRGISNPHGAWLQFLLEWGVPGGLAFVTIKIRMLLKIWRQRVRIFCNDSATGCFGLLAAFLLNSLVSGIFYYSISLMLAYYSLGALFAHMYPEEAAS